jgi:hypothetical protein
VVPAWVLPVPYSERLYRPEQGAIAKFSPARDGLSSARLPVEPGSTTASHQLLRATPQPNPIDEQPRHTSPQSLTDSAVRAWEQGALVAYLRVQASLGEILQVSISPPLSLSLPLSP